MSEQPFTNREIQSKFDVLSDKLDAHALVHTDILITMKEGFAAIHARQDTTNGRVKKTELYVAYANGGLAIIALIAVPLLMWAMYSLANLQATISDVLNDELSHYEFEIVE